MADHPACLMNSSNAVGPPMLRFTQDMQQIVHIPPFSVFSPLNNPFSPDFTWKFSFSSLLAEVMNTTASEDPVYEDILREDKRLRAHDVPKGLEWPRVAPGEENWPGFPEGEAIGRTFQRWVVASLQNIGKHLSAWCLANSTKLLPSSALMYLHRPFAWRAISGAEEITWRHRYWRSTASVYHTYIFLLFFSFCR